MRHMREHLPREAIEAHPRRWSILFVLCTSLVLVFITVSSVNVALPSMQTELGASGSDLQWISDSYILAFAGLLLPFGALGDRWGRKEVLLAGIVVFGVFSTLAAFSTSPGEVIRYRAITGAGAALIMPATLSIVSVVFPASERPKAVAVWAAFAGVGGLLGPITSGILLRFFWWGSVFLIAAPLAGIVLSLVLWLVPTSRDDEQRPLDMVGAALSILGLGCLLYGIIEGPELGWGNPLLAGWFGGAAVALWGFVRWERRVRFPLLDPAFFANRAFTLGAMTITLTFFAMFGSFFLLTQYFQFAQGHTPLGAGVRTLPPSVVMILMAPRTPAVVSRFGTRLTISVGLAVAATGVAIIAAFTPASPYWQMALALAVLAMGMALLMPPATHAIVASLPTHKAGVGSAVNDTTREAGGSIGIAVLGTLLSVGYRGGMEDRLDGFPPAVAEEAGDSIGGALRAARELPAAAAEQLRNLAVDAFDRGMTLAFSIAAGVLLAAAAAIFRLYPEDGMATAGGASTGAGTAAGAEERAASPGP